VLKRVSSWFLLLRAWCAATWALWRHRIAHDRYMMATPIDEATVRASFAMKRVIDARLFPPDCLSAGAMHGGPALFLRTDKALEVFIGVDYEHAADKLIEWWEAQHRAGVAPPTKSTTKLNRHQRRAWKSQKRERLL